LQLRCAGEEKEKVGIKSDSSSNPENRVRATAVIETKATRINMVRYRENSFDQTARCTEMQGGAVTVFTHSVIDTIPKVADRIIIIATVA